MSPQQVLDKVKKLLSLAKSSNQHEAALAAQRAQELIDKHRLSEAMLSSGSSEPIKDFSDDPLDSQRSTWKARLAVGIARQNVCKVYRSGEQLYIIGRGSNVNAVRYIYGWLRTQIDVLAILDGIGHTNNWKQNFCLGAVDTVLKRLVEAQKVSANELRSELSAQGLEIVLVDRALAVINQQKAELNTWVAQNTSLVSGRGTGNSRHNDSAREAGRRAGHNVRMDKSAGSLGQALRLK